MNDALFMIGNLGCLSVNPSRYSAMAIDFLRYLNFTVLFAKLEWDININFLLQVLRKK